MKNIHLIPTDKPSRFSLNSSGKYHLTKQLYTNSPNFTAQNIYITNNEEIKEGDIFIHPDGTIERASRNLDGRGISKIILTSDQDLIKDGVQAIDDEFLEWFVMNPTCEEVEVIYGLYNPSGRKVNFEILNQNHSQCVWKYKIIIPKEEPKLINNCPKCGLDLVIRESCTPICADIDCGGIVISNETLKEWQLKEEPKEDEMVGIEFYKTADEVISVNKKHNMKYKTVLNISIKGEDKHKNIFKVKSKYYKLNNEEKETLLKGLLFWARQEINNLHPEQE